MNEKVFEFCIDFDEESKVYKNVLNKLKRVFEEMNEKEKVVMIGLIGDEKAKRLILFGNGNFLK